VSRKPDILILTALLSEAKPIISRFNLRQFETRPFRVFRRGNLLLIVSGVGKDNTLKALNFVDEHYTLSHFKTALNVGTAGCNNGDIPVGSLFQTHGEPRGLPELTLKTFDAPVTHLETDEICLVDMEAEYFLDALKSNIPEERLFVLKVVSDHLDDSIQKSVDINGMIGDTIPLWESLLDDYPDKMISVFNGSHFEILESDERILIENAALRYRFTHQELKQLIDMALDFRMWDETGIGSFLKGDFKSGKDAFRKVKALWTELKNRPKSYADFTGTTGETDAGGKSLVPVNRDSPGFGRCPVASEKTRCCNLLTLDAVEGCGYDCSYCSIRYFYDGDSIGIDENFIDKLAALEIDPLKTYHIGTGQSSDSLMWGNKAGILDALLDFADEHPNVILELKTKSDNISHLSSRNVPANVLTTWSLNPQVIIENEEHFTASLEQRLNAAGRMAEKGNLVGFHFHPMVYYDKWEEDYESLIQEVLKRFNPDNVVMVSLGTLTFIKPVIKKMRGRKMKSRILQMPLEDAEGKYSYPLDVKRVMFRKAYDLFTGWHNRVFFYMCMEDAGLWKDVFGYEYSDNETFEAAMLKSYEGKIREKRYSDR